MRRRPVVLRTEIGFLLALGLVLAAFRVEWSPSDVPRSMDRPDVPDVILSPDMIPTTIERVARPTAPSPVPPEPADDLREVVESLIVEEQPWDMQPVPLASSDLPLPPSIDPPIIEVPPSTYPDEIFEVAEVMPELIGGIPSLQSRLTYPAFCRTAGIEGQVFIQFIVDTDGTVTNAELFSGESEEAAMRPLWRRSKERDSSRGGSAATPYVYDSFYRSRSDFSNSSKNPTARAA